MEERFARHYVLKEIGEEGQKKLLSSKVLLVGAGGLGSAAALYLAAAGVGTLGIADPDEVELANLQRQIIHDTERLGKNKALSAKESILKLNPEIHVNAYPFRLTTENISKMIEEYDFILDCVDSFGSKFLINDACVLARKPFCHAGVVRFSGQVMTYAPGRGPCLRCMLGNVPQKGEYPLCKTAGVLGAAVVVIGCLQAAEAIKYLVGAGELLTGRVFRIDLLSMRSSTASFEKADPDCPVCGKEGFSLKEHREEYGE